MGKKKGFKRSYRKKPETPIHRKRWFWSTITLLILTIALAFFFASSIFQITEIKILGLETLDPAEIRPIIEKGIILDIAFLRLNNIFLINGLRINKKLKNTFPEISSVNVKRSFPGSITVTIVERGAVASWCRDYGECFLIDKEGVIFKETTSSAQLVVIKGGDGTVSLSETPISPDEMKFIIEVWRELENIVDLAIFNVNNPDLVIQTAEGWDIRFTLMDLAQVQTEKLILVLEKKIPKEKRSKLDYIDVRFNDRAYFKYKAE